METITRANTLQKLSEVVGNEENYHYKGTLLIRTNGGIVDIGAACMGELQLQRSMTLGKSKISNILKLFFGIRRFIKYLPPELYSDIFNVFPKTSQHKRTVVVGVGGCGVNLVSSAEKQFPGACEYYACDTDIQALPAMHGVNKILLNRDDSDLMRAEKVLETIIQKNTEIVIVATGSSGKTGSGLAPLIAKELKKRGIITVAAATTTLKNEGRDAESVSKTCLSRLKECVDGFLMIDSDKLAEYYAHAPLTAYFDGANEIFTYLVGCISMTDALKEFLNNCGSITVGTAYRPGNSDSTIAEVISYSKRYGTSLEDAEQILVWVESGEPARYSEKEVRKIINKQFLNVQWLKVLITKGNHAGVRVTMVGSQK